MIEAALVYSFLSFSSGTPSATLVSATSCAGWLDSRLD
jgi:hypothetical protein